MLACRGRCKNSPDLATTRINTDRPDSFNACIQSRIAPTYGKTILSAPDMALGKDVTLTSQSGVGMLRGFCNGMEIAHTVIDDGD
ncbi:MAG: hypothetical protein IPN42_19155 [Methylococcaceae bacterium]|nr:hypothetical protein [Methylococcaceae bacterium]